MDEDAILAFMKPFEFSEGVEIAYAPSDLKPLRPFAKGLLDGPARVFTGVAESLRLMLLLPVLRMLLASVMREL